MFENINEIIEVAKEIPIEPERVPILNKIIEFIQSKKDRGQVPKLNFICTHNSRRSQLSQIWCTIAAANYNIQVESSSAGTEVTAMNERIVESLIRMGVKIEKKGDENPYYNLFYSNEHPPIHCFSKVIEDDSNPKEGFAAIMTCSNADDNCPFVPGCESRISLRYEDPKAFDNTPLEIKKYDERSLQIASEMLFIFSNIK